MPPARRLRILDVFNRYRFVGGEEKAVEQIHANLSEHHDLEWCRFESQSWAGPHAPGGFTQLRKTFYNGESRRSFEQRVDAFQPDVALFHNIYPVGSPSLYHAAVLCSLPVIQMVHNFRPFSVGGTLMVNGHFTPESLRGNYWREVRMGAWQGSVVKTAIFALVLKMLHRSGWLRAVKQWICISEFMRRKFSEAGVPEERLAVLRHFWQTPSGVAAPIQDAGYYLFLARLVEVKGIRVLLNAWHTIEKKLGDATPELHIAGEGPMEGEIVEAARAHPKIRFLGLIDGEVKSREIRRCRAMLAPSIWWEPLGLVTYEAYDRAKPMLAAASGGLTETIEQGVTGFLHAPGNSASLVEDVLRMESMTPEQRQAMGQAGQRWLQHHADPGLWLARFEEIAEAALRMR